MRININTIIKIISNTIFTSSELFLCINHALQIFKKKKKKHNHILRILSSKFNSLSKKDTKMLFITDKYATVAFVPGS